jgi:hypothetical protein
MYTPHDWVLLKITGTDPHYRVFASWCGGYLWGSRWRLNSGVLSAEEDNEYYYFYGYSKSIYKCHKETYGIRNSFSMGALSNIVENSGNTVHLLEVCPDVMNINWINFGRNK